MAAEALTNPQWDELGNLRFTTRNVRVFRNATIILMSDVGQSKKQTAGTLGCSPVAVDNIRAAYRQNGVAGLKPKSPPGRISRATPEYREAIRAAIATSPHDLGFRFSVWSVNRLRAYLQQTTGIALSEDQFRRILHQGKFSVQRPKHTMKGKRDEAAHDTAKAELRDLKKKPSKNGSTKS